MLETGNSGPRPTVATHVRMSSNSVQDMKVLRVCINVLLELRQINLRVLCCVILTPQNGNVYFTMI